jgi:signal transduction histidine kinase
MTEMGLFESFIFDDVVSDILNIVNNANIGLWDFDVSTKKVRWSIGFYNLLGYEPGEIECSYSNFIDNLLYHRDKKKFLTAINHRNSDKQNAVNVRLLTKQGYQWFQGTVQQQQDDKITGTFINIHAAKVSALEAKAIKSKTAEKQILSKLGAWEIDIATSRVTLDEEAFAILELRRQPVSLTGLLHFFETESHVKLTDAMEGCIKHCRPFDLDLKIKTARSNEIWVKMKAIGNIDDFGNCVSITGIIQDIDRRKKIERGLKSSLNLVSRKNERLQNFTYIVSHNLRSYANNLQFMVNLHTETTSEEDRLEVFTHIKSLSTSLNTTIEHLNEIVKFEAEINQDKSLIEFDLLFKNIVNALQSNISMANATIISDFSECPTILYLPAYLESIFHNLLTNALKYRDAERPAVIKCESKKIGSHTYLTFEDTGIGIDLERHGQKVFGMYQTFHKNKDSHGIGLFITRNQIEALGGSIEVESEVGVGTKFIIKLT